MEQLQCARYVSGVIFATLVVYAGLFYSGFSRFENSFDVNRERSSTQQAKFDIRQRDLLHKYMQRIDSKFEALEVTLKKQLPTEKPPLPPPSRMLYGVEIQEGFSLPQHCPWLSWTDVCYDDPKYIQWLQKWASNQSSLHPQLGALPAGNSLWLGTGHTFQTASAIACQHHWELQMIEVLRCTNLIGGMKIKAVGTCPKKSDALHSEVCESCVFDLPSNCKLVPVPPNSRCDNRAYANMRGVGGLHESGDMAHHMFNMPNATFEDLQCGVDRIPFPTCSTNIARFTFSNGHVATIIHNHVLQHYDHGLEQLAKFLDLEFSNIDTIVYASPWDHATARAAWPDDKYLLKADSPTYFFEKYKEDIIDYATNQAGFKGNVVFTSWHTSDKFAGDILSLPDMVLHSEWNHLDAALVLSKDVVGGELRNDWCAAPGRECGEEIGRAENQQCIPGIPDVVAWDVARLLRR